MTAKQLHNHFWNKGIFINIYKWLGKYDIVFNGETYITDARTINGDSKRVIEYFEDIVSKIQRNVIKPVNNN